MHPSNNTATTHIRVTLPGVVGCLCRSTKAKPAATINPVSNTEIGDAPKRMLNGADLTGDTLYVLEGIRVLDLTRVLAGPVWGRTLAGKSNPFPF
jgi:hypothetical protein